MPLTIDNSDLTIEKLPKPDDHESIFSFAMTFDGYKYYGSLEECAKQARRKARNTLSNIRNELFFSARASRHCDNDKYIQTYAELYPLLKQAITNDNIR